MKKINENLTYDDVTRVHLRVYNLVGLIPYRKSELNIFRKYFTKIYFNFINLTINLILLVSTVLSFARNEGKIEYIFENVMMHSMCLRFLYMSFQTTDLIYLMRFCKELWQSLVIHESKIVKKFEKNAWYFLILFAFMTISGFIFYTFSYQLTSFLIPKHNDTGMRIIFIRYQADFHDKMWCYGLISIFENILFLSNVPIVTATETLGPFLIMVTSGYLRVLETRLSMMRQSSYSICTEKCNEQQLELQQKIRCLSVQDVVRCIKFHQKIVIFGEKIEHFMCNIFLIQVLASVYNISLVGFEFLQSGSLRFLNILFISASQLLTCQWVSEVLLTESKAIANAAYNAALVHSEYEPKANHMLFLLMLRAQKPIQLTAGKYIKLSLDTFKRMFMSAVSFFTFLQSMQS